MWACQERGWAPSRCCRLNPGVASTSGYGKAQNTMSWCVPTPLQEAWEELATVKAVVTSLEEEAVLSRSQRMESDRRCVGERTSVSSFCSLADVMSDARYLF
jgi:hypothetical protein